MLNLRSFHQGTRRHPSTCYKSHQCISCQLHIWVLAGSWAHLLTMAASAGKVFRDAESEAMALNLCVAGARMQHTCRRRKMHSRPSQGANAREHHENTT